MAGKKKTKKKVAAKPAGETLLEAFAKLPRYGNGKFVGAKQVEALLKR